MRLFETDLSEATFTLTKSKGTPRTKLLVKELGGNVHSDLFFMGIVSELVWSLLVINLRNDLFFKLFQVTNILERFPVWKEYKDQKHDLFISDRPVSGYLTGNIMFQRRLLLFIFLHLFKVLILA